MPSLFSSRSAFVAIVCILCLAISIPRTSFAVTPESPEVKDMVKRGLKYLEDKTHEKLGGKCLIGLAFYKEDKEGKKDHPKIKEAIKACESGSYKHEDIYSLGIAIMFLCDIDPEGHRSLIEEMLAHLLSKQKECGGWGYENMTTGDTSQTQYAVLGMWMAEGNGIKVPIEAEENVANWLLRTQDPTGGWGYQGKDSGSFTRQQQSEVHGSVTSAGLGSLYIVADQLHLTTPKEPEPDGPKALRIVRDGAPKRQPRTKKVDQNMTLRALNDGDRWFPQHFKMEGVHWLYYYLYAFERYQSFRELGEGRVEKEPAWYNAYYKLLKEKQEKDGSWFNQNEGREISTAFAVLFLLRSAQKAIVKVANLGDGVLLGGMGLPPNVADLKEKDGKVVDAAAMSGSIEELLAVLEDDTSAAGLRLAESDTVIEISGDVTKRVGQVAKLRSLVSAPTFEARLVAVRSLGKTGNLDNVPVLIYALTDPDLRVVREADKALRFVSRKFEGYGFPKDPKPSKGDLDKLRDNWKKWYLSIKPDAELLD